MKPEMKKKQILDLGFVIPVGYCQFQKLLWHMEPVSYYANCYGWRADQYKVYSKKYGTVIISTGYEPISSVPMQQWSAKKRSFKTELEDELERKANLRIKLSTGDKEKDSYEAIQKDLARMREEYVDAILDTF